jgi:Haemolysin XhlA
VTTMSEPTNQRDLSEIREWLVRLDTKLDFLSDVKKTADEAGKTAHEALLLAKDNEKDIDSMKKTQMWAIGLTVPTILTIAGTVATIVF